MKKVVLGVTGCIAAYKAVEVLRGLQKRGVDVQVAMTAHATAFVGPLTFRSISGHPVVTGMFDETDDPEIKHIQLAQWADLLLVAPATANAIAKFANGLADDFLSTLYISTTAPVALAPAMNVEMWGHPATQANVSRLRDRGVHFVDPAEGYLACRTVGAGRLAEPDEIVERALEIVSRNVAAGSTGDMLGERVLITAGPTFEAIDPVRGLTNRSSGKMGYALAEAAVARGAEVTVVSGPVSLEAPAGAKIIGVRSAAEMYEATMSRLDDATLVIMAAAVADYSPIQVASSKMKKKGGKLLLELEPTRDILAAAGQRKNGRILVGFAAETDDILANARQKLIGKNADLMVANDVSAAASGFDADTNQVTLITADEEEGLPLMSKKEAAAKILDAAMALKRKTQASV
ncbi:MAG TPA: bifunctional phosphopantothenoylcysteine decarboxylase/phosphopantothenate--cysteine ligase CoaBC [Blastocatellia bacterium]|nr:bifunctional phosphopantothenoylcysteine decarboxylase/phosphopantothenate--cysteine ligase CoaBC [Blastocatellia bacterium]